MKSFGCWFVAMVVMAGVGSSVTGAPDAPLDDSPLATIIWVKGHIDAASMELFDQKITRQKNWMQADMIMKMVVANPNTTPALQKQFDDMWAEIAVADCDIGISISFAQEYLDNANTCLNLASIALGVKEDDAEAFAYAKFANDWWSLANIAVLPRLGELIEDESKQVGTMQAFYNIVLGGAQLP